MAHATTTATQTAAPATVAIGIDDNVATMVTMLQDGKATVAQVKAHLTAHPYPITEVAQLATCLDGATFGAILVAQQQLAVKAATAGHRNGNGQAVTLKVGQSGTIVLRGLGRNPLSMYPGQARRVARDVFGMDDAAWDASPIGKWVATNPVETYSKDTDYAKYDGGLDKLAKAVQAGYATVSGDTVAVSLAPDRD